MYKCNCDVQHLLRYLSKELCSRPLTKFKKETTNPETYKQFYLQLITEYPSSENICTDGSKTEEGVAAAVVSTKRIPKPFTCRIPHGSTIYIAELRALKHQGAGIAQWLEHRTRD